MVEIILILITLISIILVGVVIKEIVLEDTFDKTEEEFFEAAPKWVKRYRNSK